MDILIATKRPVSNPGRFLRAGKTSDEMIGDVANVIFSKKTAWSLITHSSSWMVDVYDTITAGALSLSLIEKDAPTVDFLDVDCNVIDKKVIKDAKVKFNNPIWSGAFKSEDHYKLIVESLPSDDSDIVICDMASLKSQGFSEVESTGIYVLDQHSLLPAAEFSIKKLERLRVAIFDTFSNLGVKEIVIEDQTDLSVESSVSISKELIALAPKIGLNLNRKTSFEISTKYNERLSYPNVVKAKHAAKGLSSFPELRAIAEYLISEPGSLNSLEKKVVLDLSFGVSADLLTVLQGAFQGGYKRVFHVSLKF